MTRTHPDRGNNWSPRSCRGPLLIILGICAAHIDATPLYAQAPTSAVVDTVWFEDLDPLPAWDATVDNALMGHTTAILRGQAPDPHDLPAALRNDRAARVVLLSVSDGRSRARVRVASGAGVIAAVARAAEAQLAACPQPCQASWIKLDVVQEVVTATTISTTTTHRWDRSIYGLALDRDHGVAILPEDIVARTLIDSDRHIQAKALAAYVGDPTLDSRLRQGRVRAFVFTTRALFSQGQKVHPLFRGHRMFDTVSRKQALAAARMAGDYLVRAVDEHGRFAYLYRAKQDRILDRYNILRHAGTVYSMLQLYEVTQDRQLLDAASRALQWLLRSIHSAPNDARAAVLVANGHAKLGGNGLAAIAIAKFIQVTGDATMLPVLQRLGRRMQSLQADDGRFIRQKATYPEDLDTGFISEYYPGEAILGLTQIHAVDGSAHWLDTAERAARYLIEVRDRDKAASALPHDHWLLYGLNALYRQRPEALYIEHAARLTHTIGAAQRRIEQPRDWVGSYYRPPRATPTATRTEGLAAACRLFRDHQRPQDAAVAWAAIELGIRFQLQTQCDPASAMYLPNPQRALGGFHKSLTDFDIQIDYVQHNISALLAYADMAAQGPPTPAGRQTRRVSSTDFPQWIARHRAERVWTVRQAAPKLTRATLQQSLELGKQFLLNNQRPAGNFNYMYDFVTQTLDHNDNAVRQAGAAWGLALILQHQPDPSTQAALDRALQFFFEHSTAGPGPNTTLIAYPGEQTCKSGTVALAALAIIDYLRAVQKGTLSLPADQERALRSRLAGYLGFLRSMRLDNGRFAQSWSLRTAAPSAHSSPYSDGEVLLCFVKAAKYLGHHDLVPVIEASAMEMARHYSVDAWRIDPDSNDTKGFFQWSCMALWEYQDAGWAHAEACRDYVVSLAWWMIHTHHTLRRLRNTAYAYEGLIPAYRIALQQGDQAAVNELAYTIDQGLFKLTTWQVGGPLQAHNGLLRSHDTRDPLAVGGVLNHRSESPLRIDVTQHQMHALILALEHVYPE